jgi:hypothetical protein
MRYLLGSKEQSCAKKLELVSVGLHNGLYAECAQAAKQCQSGKQQQPSPTECGSPEGSASKELDSKRS